MPYVSPIVCICGDDASDNVIDSLMQPNDRLDVNEEVNGLASRAGRPSGWSPPDTALVNGLDSRSFERIALRLESI